MYKGKQTTLTTAPKTLNNSEGCRLKKDNFKLKIVRFFIFYNFQL